MLVLLVLIDRGVRTDSFSTDSDSATMKKIVFTYKNEK